MDAVETSGGPRPLENIKVVDASAYIAGPFAAMILADLGADVVRLEPPSGDPYRRFGPMFGGASSCFRATNQNKRLEVADLKSDEGQEQLAALLADADVLITNWRPAIAASHGLTPEGVRARFPQLIWVRVSGFGQDGPLADRPAYDTILYARSGVMLANGQEPQKTPGNTTDKITAMMAAQSATAALLARSTTGTGTICDVSMLDATSYFYGADLSAGHRMVDTEVDGFPAGIVNNRTTFQTSDSWILMSPVTGKQLRSAMAAVGRSDDWSDVVASGPDLLWSKMTEIFDEELPKRSTGEWVEAFTAADVPITPVLTFEEHLADEQVAHNGTYHRVHDPAIETDFLQVRWPARYDGQPVPPVGRPSPSLPPKPADP